MQTEVQFLFSAHHLIMVYICTKFRENILNILQLCSGHDLNTNKYKGA